MEIQDIRAGWLLTLKEASECFHEDLDTIRKRIQAGEIPVERMGRDQFIKRTTNQSSQKIGDTWITTRQAANIFGVTVARVIQLIDCGALPAERPGRDYLLKESVVKKHILTRPTGRPPSSVSST